MCRKLILLASFVLLLGLVGIQTVRAAEVDIRIANGADDVEERLRPDRNGALDITSSDLEFPYEDFPADDLQRVAMRFLNVPIPQGMLVTEAYIEFEVDETKGGTSPVNVIIDGELSPNAAAFVNTPMNVSQRTFTTALVPWSVPEWTAVNDKFQTPNIAAIIQEIVDQPGWASGNALVITIQDDPANPSTGVRCAESYDGEATAAPLLHIKYGADPFLQDGGPDGIVSMEAENYHNKTKGQSDSEWVEVGPTGGFTGAAGMQVADGTEGTNNTNYAAESARLDFEVAFLGTGTHYVWVRAWGPDGSGDSCHAGLDGQEISTCDRMSGWNNVYAWSNATMDNAPSTFEVPSSGVHVVNIWMREDGLIVDKVVLTTNPAYVPEGDGPPESPHGFPVKAYAPIPADGAIDVTDTVLQWTGADAAVLHRVYLSTDATIDEADFLIETQLTLVAVDLLPGTTYYWRVDEVQADGTVTEGDIWTFSTMPLEAHFPTPADGATDVALDAKLSWTAGKGAILHDVYFGTDQAAVAAKAPTTFKGKLMATSFDPGPLQPFTTYYWKVDEFAGITTNEGPVWSFSTVEYLIIDEAEKTLNYDNTVAPFYSELVWDTPQDLTYGGVADLSFRFQGRPGPEGDVSIDEATGTYTVTGSGADVWGSSDQFHYGYVKLSGDGEISARVVSNGTGSNRWAKGGVMIRETTAADSKHMFMALTGGDGNGIAFQGRPVTGQRSNSFHGDITAAPPHWVKLTRAGNTITAYHSADGVTWSLFTDASPDGAQTNPIDVEMADPVLIGLAVTSHAAGEKRTFTFDNLNVVGNIGAAIEHQDVGIPSNSAEPLYVTLEDSTGAAAVVAHSDPAATRISQWWKWKIPLSAFGDAGVNLTAAAKLYIGVGDRINPTPGGSGVVRIDDILVVKPVIISEPADVTAPGDNVKGVPNDGVYSGSGQDNGWPANEHPALAIDDKTNTKFLHFKGNFQPTGLQVTPSAGPTVVTGLTFTTANDASERDPIAYELYGSNVGIDGPYELIAAGDIVDFSGTAAWPRFTKNTTPIAFDNAVAYEHYQVLFPAVRNAASANSMQIAEVELIGTTGAAGAAELVSAFAFGSRLLDCPTYNDPTVNYTMVHHTSPEAVQYDAARGFGYEVIYPTDSPFGDRAGYGVFGPFDDSPNNRNEYPDECPEQLYDSFIGAKSFTSEVSATTMGDKDTPSPNPEGIIFRVDVPNGLYRFVGAFGEADNNHAHRILAEDGGSGPPANIGPNHVVLVHNHDQAQYAIGEAVNDALGNGVFARVGFDGRIPPPGDGVAPSPQFINMDQNGVATDADPDSPVLEVTQGYIRIHQLQGNSNDGPGGTRDPNGGDIVILELWKVG